MQPAPEQVAGGPHRGGIDIGLGEHAPTQEHGNFLRIDAVVFGFAAMDGFHVQGMPEDEGYPLPDAQVRQPVPRKDAFDGDDDVVTIRRDDLEEGLGVSREILLDHDLPILAEDAYVHRAGMEVDTTVHLMLFGVESHEVSSSLARSCFSHCQHTTGVC